MKFVYCTLILMCATLFGCSEREDETPSYVDRNMFNMPDYSSAEEMALREAFYEKTSCYLIFNDTLYDREVTTVEIGARAIEALRELDEVACISFASVYKDFKNLDEFLKEIRTMNRDKKKNPGTGAKE